MTDVTDAPIVLRKTPNVPVTEGAGFIGANFAGRRACHGRNVPIVDSPARERVAADSDRLPAPAISLGGWTGRSGAASAREEAWACASR
jgi:hypothetical protein